MRSHLVLANLPDDGALPMRALIVGYRQGRREVDHKVQLQLLA